MTERLPCRHGSPALRWPGRHGQRGRAAPGLGAENHQGRLGLLCQVRGCRGAAGPGTHLEGAAPRTLTASRARDPALPGMPPARGRSRAGCPSLARPRELEAIVKDLPQGGSPGPQDGLAAFLGPGSSGSHLAASRRALCCSGVGAARCLGGPQALLLHPGVTIRKKQNKTKNQFPAPSCRGLGWGARSMYFLINVLI